MLKFLKSWPLSFYNRISKSKEVKHKSPLRWEHPVTFGVGVYTGIYLCQNYQVPRVDEPKEVWRKVKEIADQYKKPPES